MQFEIQTNSIAIHVHSQDMGEDLCVSIWGGDAPHVGSTVLALPRPSLTGQGTSATLSVLNRPGHKDDAIAAAVAKELSSRLNIVVSCTAGIHMDHATPQIIGDIVQTVPRIVDAIIQSREEDTHEQGHH